MAQGTQGKMQGTMQVSIQCRHCDVDDDLRTHCEEKLGAIERMWDNAQSANVRLNGERGRYSAEITLVSVGLISRAEERGDNLRAAFDSAVHKLERQLTSFKKKVQSSKRRHNNRDDAAGTILHPLATPGLELAASADFANASADLSSDGASALSINGTPGANTSLLDGTGAPVDEEDSPVRVKRFAIKPMSAEEAALQMDLLGHDFFVFRDDKTDEVSVVYRRHSGGYGLIEPVPD